MPTPQECFDDKYVTSTELCVDLKVSRVSVLNKRRAGGLPGGIEIQTRGGSTLVLLWEREHIKPHVDAWRKQLARRQA